MSGRIVRIGGASGAWGDSVAGPIQLVRRAAVDYLSFDYLAEVTMSILARAWAKDPAAGWATDFVDGAMREIVGDVARRGIRVLSNAGGINPRGCADALRRLAEEAGVTLRIAVVEGDDVRPWLEQHRDAVREMTTGAPLPSRVLSANAYLGALPIAAALDRGADVVITGRCVDSALPLAALIHEFGWRADDWDRLAAGSLVGHLLECGPQGVGGLHTDWERVERWDDIGYPIAECRADGSFVVTKPDGTGGLVEPATVAEQMLYEIGDPSAYVLPDVVCDFTQVTMAQDGPHRVGVGGVRGRPRTDRYKVSVTHQDGWRGVGALAVIGIDAARKAERTAEALLARARQRLEAAGLDGFRRTHVEVLGAESIYGPHSRARPAREVSLRVVVEHREREAIELFGREIGAAGISWAPGTTGIAGRPKPTPIIRLFSCLIPKDAVPPTVTLDGTARPVAVPTDGEAGVPAPLTRSDGGGEVVDDGVASMEVPLIRLAFARSGDKGDSANIGVIAREPRFVPILRRALTAARVAAYFAHLVKGEVARYEVPGIGGFNFVLDQALGDGGMASPRIDPLAKGFAQMLLDLPIRVPRELLAP
ncbi:MAG TPA: acyclic terpene utilization AtuA family protein [Hyphomicrobiales bacterium]|nr:acyclic terpene utilization AtuA family protein [Hyphomicrobiales bacterium]